MVQLQGEGSSSSQYVALGVSSPPAHTLHPEGLYRSVGKKGERRRKVPRGSCVCTAATSWSTHPTAHITASASHTKPSLSTSCRLDGHCRLRVGKVPPLQGCMSRSECGTGRPDPITGKSKTTFLCCFPRHFGLAGIHFPLMRRRVAPPCLLTCIFLPWLCSAPQAKICLTQWCVTGVAKAHQAQGPFASRTLWSIVFLLDMSPAWQRQDFNPPKSLHGISQSSTLLLVFKRCLA